MGKKVSLNSFLTGIITGLVLPAVVFIIVWLVAAGDMTFPRYIDRIISGNVLTHFISICVFPNVFAFLLFNRLDYLNSSKGVLGITIIWALLTFIIKFTM